MLRIIAARPAQPAAMRAARGSVMQDLGQELLRALRPRLAEEIVLRGVLDDRALVHEDHAIRDLAGEAHLVRDAHHGHAFLGELHHDVEHLVHHLGIERRRGLVEQHADRIHRQGAGDRDALLLSAGELPGKLVLLRDQADAVEVLEPTLDRLFLLAMEHLDLGNGQVLR